MLWSRAVWQLAVLVWWGGLSAGVIVANHAELLSWSAALLLLILTGAAAAAALLASRPLALWRDLLMALLGRGDATRPHGIPERLDRLRAVALGGGVTWRAADAALRGPDGAALHHADARVVEVRPTAGGHRIVLMREAEELGGVDVTALPQWTPVIYWIALQIGRQHDLTVRLPVGQLTPAQQALPFVERAEELQRWAAELAPEARDGGAASAAASAGEQAALGVMLAERLQLFRALRAVSLSGIVTAPLWALAVLLERRAGLRRATRIVFEGEGGMIGGRAFSASALRLLTVIPVHDGPPVLLTEDRAVALYGFGGYAQRVELGRRVLARLAGQGAGEAEPLVIEPSLPPHAPSVGNLIILAGLVSSMVIGACLGASWIWAPRYALAELVPGADVLYLHAELLLLPLMMALPALLLLAAFPGRMTGARLGAVGATVGAWCALSGLVSMVPAARIFDTSPYEVLEIGASRGRSLRGAQLEAGRLQGIRLERPALEGAAMQGALLQGCDLQRGSLKGARLDGAAMQGCQLEGVELRDARLKGALLQTAVLRGADLRGATLRDVALQRAQLRGADLRGSDLRGADLRGADLREARLTGARFEGARYDKTTVWSADARPEKLRGLKPAEVDPGAPWRGAVLVGEDFVQDDLEGADFRGAVLIDCSMGQARLNRARFEGAVLINSDLAQARLSGARFERAALFNTSLIQVDLTDADLSRAFIVQSDLGQAELQRSSLASSRVHDSQITQVSFEGVDLTHATLLRVDLTQSDLTATRGEGASLDDCTSIQAKGIERF